MKTKSRSSFFTIFCLDQSGHGTIWIEAVEARGITEAIVKGLRRCSEDWNQDASTIHVLGVARGDVDILEWNDLVN